MLLEQSYIFYCYIAILLLQQRMLYILYISLLEQRGLCILVVHMDFMRVLLLICSLFFFF